MYTSLVGILVLLVFTVLIHRGLYPSLSASRRRSAWEITEIAVLVVCLLAVPFIEFDLLWFSGWLGAYLALGILAPVLLELVARRRSLTEIGFRWPVNRKVMYIVTVLLVIYLVARLARPGFFQNFEWRHFVSNSIVFALIEETLFRGMLQTRLESLLGSLRAWILSGLFFGFYHYYVHYLGPGKTPTLEQTLALAFVTALGLLLGVIYAKTRSLLPSFLVHAVNNL